MDNYKLAVWEVNLNVCIEYSISVFQVSLSIMNVILLKRILLNVTLLKSNISDSLARVTF